MANAPAQSRDAPGEDAARVLAAGVPVVERWGEWLGFSPEEFFEPGSAAASQFLLRSVRAEPATATTGASAARRRLWTCVLRAQLRRQIFSADLARQRHAGGAVPGVCPASATKIYYGGNIDDATAGNGERYAKSENAFAYRKALRADCTCNGRTPSGLAPVDLTLDTSLRPGFKDLWQARQGRPDPPAVGAQRPQERRERGLAVVAGNPPLREG